MTSRAGGRLCRERGDDVLDFGLGGEANRRLRVAEAVGAQPHLVDGLFAGNIDDAQPLRGERAANLDQQRRFADAGLAAEQKHGAGNEAAAGHAVEFADAGDDAGCRFAGAAKVGQGKDAALAAGQRRRRAGVRRFLDHRIPGAAGIAAALPARRDGAAALTDERGASFGHLFSNVGLAVIASEAKQSNNIRTGLLRRIAPRNDGTKYAPANPLHVPDCRSASSPPRRRVRPCRSGRDAVCR